MINSHTSARIAAIKKDQGYRDVKLYWDDGSVSFVRYGFLDERQLAEVHIADEGRTLVVPGQTQSADELYIETHSPKRVFLRFGPVACTP